MDESYGTYVDDEYFDNHDYDDTDDDTDDDNDHKKDSYTAAGAAPTQTCSWARQGFSYTRGSFLSLTVVATLLFKLLSHITRSASWPDPAINN